MQPHKQAEKRKYPRLNAHILMLYKTEDSPKGYYINFTRNISQGGALLTTDREFAKGTKIKLLTELSLHYRNESFFNGEVIASEKEHDNFYATRIKFINRNELIYAEFGRIIQNKLNAAQSRTDIAQLRG